MAEDSRRGASRMLGSATCSRSNITASRIALSSPTTPSSPKKPVAHAVPQLRVASLERGHRLPRGKPHRHEALCIGLFRSAPGVARVEHEQTAGDAPIVLITQVELVIRPARRRPPLDHPASCQKPSRSPLPGDRRRRKRSF